MKKGLAALLCLALLTGCTRFNVNVQTSKTEPEQPAASLSADAEGESSAPVSAAEASGALELDAADLWQEGGYSFQARRDATYTLTRDGEAEWEVYVLDGEFEDALRYLPQAAEPVAVNEGSFSVKLGQMVYCLCDWNSFTEDEAPELGTNVLHLTEE